MGTLLGTLRRGGRAGGSAGGLRLTMEQTANVVAAGEKDSVQGD